MKGVCIQLLAVLKHVFVAPFPRANCSFGAREALIRLIVAFVALDFVESRQSEHSSGKQRCCQKVIDNTHCRHRMLLAGGEQDVPR